MWRARTTKQSPEEKAACITANATLAMAGLTFVLAGAAIWNIVLLKKQLADAHESAVTSTRAWMAVHGTGFGYTEDQKGTNHAKGTVVLTNTGPTPAFNLHLWRCAEVRNNQPSLDEFPTSDPNCLEQEIGMAGKDMPITINGFDQVHETSKDSLSSESNTHGVPHFYMWGKVIYDISAKDRRHFTKFCLFNGATQLSACVEGNDGD